MKSQPELMIGDGQLPIGGTDDANRQSSIGNRQFPLPVLDQREHRGATFHEVPVKAILNSPASTGMGFWSLNPYVGCEFGCTYCYARETHKWVMEKVVGRYDGTTVEQHEGTGFAHEASSSTDPTVLPSYRPTALPAWLAFEKQILVKTSAAAVLTRTLFPARLAGASLVIGTATDPYQPAERRFRLTRQILEALLGWRGLTIGIITKSPLILRDLPVLQQLAERHDLAVNISLSSTDPALLRRIEARSPAPHARLRTLKGLVDGGIYAGLLVAPILPGISDSREALAALMAAGKAAGARYVAGMALRLGPAARSRFLPHLEQEFPELVARYTRRYGHRESAGKDYTEALARRLHTLQQEFGFPVNPSLSHHRSGGRPSQTRRCSGRSYEVLSTQYSVLSTFPLPHLEPLCPSPLACFPNSITRWPPPGSISNAPRSATGPGSRTRSP